MAPGAGGRTAGTVPGTGSAGAEADGGTVDVGTRGAAAYVAEVGGVLAGCSAAGCGVEIGGCKPNNDRNPP